MKKEGKQSESEKARPGGGTSKLSHQNQPPPARWHLIETKL